MPRLRYAPRAVPGRRPGTPRPSFPLAAPLAVLLPVALAACADAPSAATERAGGPLAAAVAAATGPYAACGGEIPVTATATQFGVPVSGLLVNFNVLAGGGSMYAGAALTDASGVASD